MPEHFLIYTPTSGELKIAEVASRFTNVQHFQSFVESFGFRHESTVCALYISHRIGLRAPNTGSWQHAFYSPRIQEDQSQTTERERMEQTVDKW